jgi:flagellin-like hook-associated protein FlgL
MRYREILLNKTNQIDNELKNLLLLLNNQGNTENFRETIQKISELNYEIQDYINREELNPQEINFF